MKDEEPIIINEGDAMPNHVVAEGTPEFTTDPSNFMSMFGDATARAESFLGHVNERQDGLSVPVKPEAVAIQDTRGNPDVMADILRRMNGEAEHVIDTAIRNDDIGPGLQRSLISESTKHDEWKIKMTESVSTGKYTIVNGVSKKSFFENLTLLESAKKICGFLENDHAVNSKKIQKVLYYDQVYENQYNECQNFKRLHRGYKKSGNDMKMNLMADKYDHAKDKALAAKQSVKTV